MALALAGLVAALAAYPAAAQAHGPIAPAASSYFAKVLQLPAGLEAKVVDGDLRMWLRVPPSQTVVVLDYRGAPYLRFSPTGVEVNHNSSMYYLNETPVAQTPPANLSPTARAELASGDRRTRVRVARRAAARARGGRADARSLVRRPVEDPAPGRRSTGLDLRRSVARGRPDDRVVLGDRRARGLRAGGLASCAVPRSTGWSPACSRSRPWSR